MAKKARRSTRASRKSGENASPPPKPRLLPFEDLIEKIFKVDRTVGIHVRR